MHIRTAVASLLALALGATTVHAQQARDLGFGTGRQGGSQYPIGIAISQLIGKLPGVGKVSIQPGSSGGNAIAVGTNKAQYAITMMDSAIQAYEGQKPFPAKMSDLALLFALHRFNVVILVPDKSPVKEFKDLAGKRVNSGPAGYSITELSRRIYDMTGIRKEVRESNLLITDAVEQLKDGHLDGLFYSPSDWFGPFIELAQAMPIRAIPLPKDVMEKVIAADASFAYASFPVQKGVYKNLVNQVQTISQRNIIITNAKTVSEAEAYAAVKAVAENWEKVEQVEASLKLFKLEEMATPSRVVPFHPGALRYFRERGWVKGS